LRLAAISLFLSAVLERSCVRGAEPESRRAQTGYLLRLRPPGV
jgi:hypothetical protein